LRRSKFLPFESLLIRFLAKQKSQQALNFDGGFLKKMDYYDVCIKAVKSDDEL